MREESWGSLDTEALEPGSEGRRSDSENLGGAAWARNSPVGLLQRRDDVVALLPSQLGGGQHLGPGARRLFRLHDAHPSVARRPLARAEHAVDAQRTSLSQDDSPFDHVVQ